MSKIEIFLENLNPREKILFSCFICLCALFLAFKFHENFLEDIFQKNLNTDNHLCLNELKTQISQLQKTQTKLIKQIKTEEKTSQDYAQKLQLFSYEKHFFLKTIENLAQNLSLIEFRIWHKNKNLLNENHIFLKLNGDFHQMLYFIQNLENSNLYYQINKIEIENITSLKLHLQISISFITLNTQN
ncbi:hypothetical protein LNU06_02140 [Campylobacter sp. VicNov18]|uniref:hypothetical protein n=1 Tax=Campylobacter bilis TaxID=2691918 RepID=UPI00130E7DCA|nr:hypothetical protein [Campylobacter bilis]MPV63452.1 hypothetical protein [Campylobacter hepaticus]MBM0636951.1 hypothetical protein [Campylobacter bilis]MCC8277663.1 hypothetical protein [Campylobacter bilis]MCC8299272.1 hypothetical protein [Campylobacter bilis]MCC8300572.1 hypothetical protein [Campylobacter bilis]